MAVKDVIMSKKKINNSIIVIFIIMLLLNFTFVIISNGEDKKPESAKSDSPKSTASKPESLKPESPKPESPKAESPKPETPKSATSKPETSKATASKSETSKAETPKPAELTEQKPVQMQKVFDLQKWENELKAEAKQLEVLKADIDKRIEENNKTLKQINAGIKVIEEANTKRFQNVVEVYETMKAEEAAKSLSELDLEILVGIMNAMKVKKAAKILPFIEPSKAAKITLKMSGVMKNIPKE